MTQLLAPPGQPLPRRRWTTAEFERLVAGGFLREGSRTYLWDGEIIEPMAEDPPHVNAVENLRTHLQLSPADWTVNQGHPLALADGYQPQPDFVVLRGPRAHYRNRKPTPADVALLVEVADSTYPYDAGPYLQRYALEGVPLYWIVNIRGRRIEVYSSPAPSGRYLTRQDYALGATVPLRLVRDGVEFVFPDIAVLDVLRDSLEDLRA